MEKKKKNESKRKRSRVAFDEKVKVHQPKSDGDSSTGEADDGVEPIDRSERRHPKSKKAQHREDEEEDSEEDIKGGFCYAEDEDDEEDDNLGHMENEVEGEEEENQPEHTSAAEQKDEEGIRYNDAGEELVAFNLKSEREDGYFDANGNFVWKVQEQEPDAWLAGMDEGEMETLIGEAAKAQEKQLKALEVADAAAKDFSVARLDELQRQLAEMLEPKETVLQALRRLGGTKKAPTKKKRKLPKKLQKELGKDRNADGDSSPSKGEENGSSNNAEEQKKQFLRLTELADTLLGSGQTDIYQQTSDDINRRISINTAQHARSQGSYFEQPPAQGPPAPGPNTTMWEYKGVDGVVQGPYPTQVILAWQSQGFFIGDNIVQIRRIQPRKKNEDTKGEAASNELKGEVKQNQNKISAADDFANDFDSDENENEDKPKSGPAKPNLPESSSQIDGKDDEAWVPSDTIDFSNYL